jgi:hypothetical protein
MKSIEYKVYEKDVNGDIPISLYSNNNRHGGSVLGGMVAQLWEAWWLNLGGMVAQW